MLIILPVNCQRERKNLLSCDCLLHRVLPFSVSNVTASFTGYSHSLDQLEGEAGVWEVLTVLITTPEKSAQTLCAKDVDDTTISVFCS